MRYRVLPYRQGSAGAKALATALGGKVLKLVGSSYVPKPGDRVINWGNTNPSVAAVLGIDAYENPATLIREASNKLKFFNRMQAEGNSDIIPKFWTNQGDIPDEDFPIVCRTVLAGHSGDGIVIANCRAELVPAPLYVKYIKKKDEYRIHLGAGVELDQYHTIAIQRKARRNDVPDEEVDWQIRNHDRGFVFVRGGVNPPPCVMDAASRAFLATDLDFGAVDVIFNANQGRAYVLEINTAPGIEGQTIEDYRRFFQGEN